MIGRVAELGRLTELIATTRARGAAIALIEGEAGIGKSRLAAEVAALARHEGFSVLTASAHPLEGARAFGLFRDLLGIRKGGEGEHEQRIHDLLTRSTKPEDPSQTGQITDLQFQISDEFVAALEDRAARRPIALILDDLQWADPASLVTLASLIRHMTGSPLLVICTMRSVTPSPMLAGLVDDLRKHDLVHVKLAPLSDQDIVELISGQTQRVMGPRLTDQLRRCSGNPLFALELVEALNDEGVLERDATGVESRAITLPSSLRLIVLRRLSLLPRSALEILELAAILGSSFSLKDLALVSGKLVTDVYASLQSVVDAGLIEDDTGSGDVAEARLQFRHPLIWEALYEDRPPAVRAALHRQVAEALSSGGAPLEHIARHFMLGGGRGDRDAIKWLHKAGRHLGARSPDVAVDLLRRAMELADDDALRTSLAADLAPLIVLTGGLDEAEALAREVLERAADPVVAVKLQAGLAHVLVRRGQWHAALNQLEEEVQHLPEPFDAFALAPASLVRLVTGDASGAYENALRALEGARQLENQVVAATSLMTLTWVHAARGEVDEAVDTGKQAVESARRTRATFSGFLFPRLMVGGALLQADRNEEAGASFRKGIEEAGEIGSSISLPYLHSGLTLAHFYGGRWDDAVSEAETTLDLVESTGVRWTLLALGVRARICFARDEPDLVDRCLRSLESEHHDQGEVLGARYVGWIKALVAAREGRRLEAREAAARAWNQLPELRHLFGNRTLVMDLARLAQDVEANDLLDDIARAASELAEREETASSRGVALWCRGIMRSEAALLTQAISSFRAAGRPYELARACESAASIYDSAPDRERALTMLTEARGIFARLGATVDETRVTHKLRGRGSRGVPAARRERPTTGWKSLTPTEKNVIHCVIRGMSNSAIAGELVISRHTVETHMKHIFTKLSLTSRTQLAVEGAKRLAQP